MDGYKSSEELQRSVFAPEKKPKQVNTTETEKVIRVLDVYINRHQSTKGVQAELEANAGRSLELQFGISAGIVGILEKIKSELR